MYGKSGAGLISTTIESLKRCWLSNYCDSSSGLHEPCVLCDDKTWKDYQEEDEAEVNRGDHLAAAEVNDPVEEDFTESHGNENMQDGISNVEMVDAVEYSKIKEKLAEVERNLLEKDQEIEKLKEEIIRLKSNINDMLKEREPLTGTESQLLMETCDQIGGERDINDAMPSGNQNEDIFHKCPLCEHLSSNVST